MWLAAIDEDEDESAAGSSFVEDLNFDWTSSFGGVRTEVRTSMNVTRARILTKIEDRLNYGDDTWQDYY